MLGHYQNLCALLFLLCLAVASLSLHGVNKTMESSSDPVSSLLNRETETETDRSVYAQAQTHNETEDKCLRCLNGDPGSNAFWYDVLKAIPPAWRKLYYAPTEAIRKEAYAVCPNCIQKCELGKPHDACPDQQFHTSRGACHCKMMLGLCSQSEYEKCMEFCTCHVTSGAVDGARACQVW
uniref:Uncharacterized protein n=1 Tax=Chromera velia CCMP2878 TaxID=1169474 RepID=A0A0G4FC11_9ALVE|eukprot:Cvel_16269.t1-p1 / transcript=Cvel_16269.t1 / gene=Cvel_16269 / organism=Chromera_velia_CCMP2878 / gene_product=hypothetical protein / transcript_product=hypothetical protein / location=Cvel_scaffold1245:26986-27522(+) / protein_length=179 / sequence_SO=supercontig / SO=protein_coding / is_pseudo=false